ncbi:multifunctional methyltransferase subunit TRM112 [Angomonas deanei]|uniref:Trm112p-like protein, putative n=1 Tax=Angomonas deanei TaxID=59799 RepID=S9WKZ0_9TRYP|nr:multifunctional methyltransferase subunit TRM112 [Angomonas deanei]EPY39786.1 multifunctional methyltransferase subunit TRM112 [Angomonas deanei]EPY42008.1 multifunctional methyltransferase subunit TRM112 [Angomonas deanei]CAD2220121.1 Trm112p-like protein, putative [Angomonas deanei]|eukprot:EPY31223.1 multifunctional methyltransferase subunit TRM112 [Angomonas deanei]
MRLLTHNMLCCIKCNQYPLQIQPTELTRIEVDYDEEFTRRMLTRLDYDFLKAAYEELRNASKNNTNHNLADVHTMEDLPSTREAALTPEGLVLLHEVLTRIAVKNGQLVCGSCQQVYPVTDYIPNFVVDSL